MYAAEGIIARQRWGTVVIRYPKIVRRRDPVDIIAIAEIPGAAVAMAGRLVETAGRLGLGVTLAPRRLLPIKAGGRFSETDFPAAAAAAASAVAFHIPGSRFAFGITLADLRFMLLSHPLEVVLAADCVQCCNSDGKILLDQFPIRILVSRAISIFTGSAFIPWALIRILTSKNTLGLRCLKFGEK